MTEYTWEDFGLDKRGPQFELLDARLTVWGYPSNSLLDTPKDRIGRWQRSIGNRADGLLGPKQWALLQTDPKPPTPAGVLELSKFKRTLPTGKPGKPTEVFGMEDAVVPVRFRAPVDGVTTKGSSYCRDELRELDGNGEDGAAWSNTDERHTLTGTCRVTEIPGRKTDKYTPGVVFAQIHDGSDDVVILLVDARGRVILEEGLGKGNGSKKYPLFDGYQLGDVLNYVIDAHDGVIDVTVNGHHEQIDKAIEDAYFKAGCYLRGNTSNATGAGEVIIANLEVRTAA